MVVLGYVWFSRQTNFHFPQKTVGSHSIEPTVALVLF